ncbi:MAG: DUF2085 domain-containing protein [Wujia sp.]
MKIGRKYGCHQRCDRSFYFGKYQFPVCARCTGVIISSLIAMTCKHKEKISRCMLYCIPMIVDGTIQYVGIKESNNTRRFITGAMFGHGVMSLLLNVVRWFTCKIKKI